MITTVDIDNDLLGRVKAACGVERLTLKSVMHEALGAWLNEHREISAGRLSDLIMMQRRNHMPAKELEAQARERFPWLPVLQAGWRNCESSYPPHVWKERPPTDAERAERDEKLRLAKLRWMMD